ncbi:MAG TPA: ATP-binding protein [Methylibium sp.]
MAERLLAAQARLLHERTSGIVGAGLASSLLVVWLLWSHDAHAGLLAWLGLRLAMIVLLARQRSRYGREPDRRWRRRLTAITTLDGALWSVLVVVFSPAPQDPIALILLATMVGVAAVAMVAMAVHAPLHIAYSTAVLAPCALWQLLRLDAAGAYIGLSLLLYLAFIVHEGRISGRHLKEMLSLRLRLEDEAQARAQALALAERHSAVKSQFLATMSHEMRTPLHGILGLTRELMRKPQPDPAGQRDAHRQLALIEQSGQHLLELISDLLDFSRIEAGQMKMAKRPFDLAAVVSEVAALATAGARDKGLSFAVEMAGGEAGWRAGEAHWVLGDASRVRQVLLNLAGNAVKFTDRGGVKLKVWPDTGDGLVHIDVQDSGIGIAPAELAHIFDAFHQVESSFGRRYGGTGLGLTISRELARAMGGELSCISRAGQGSTFSFSAHLPRCAAPELAPPGPPHVTPLRGRVLLAEDNEVNALVAEAVLKQAGLEFETVGDGAAAVHRCIQSDAALPAIDLVLMDCHMPTLDGFAATRLIRQHEAAVQGPRLPIIALTANAYDSDRERCLIAGMDAHLPKPFRAEELRRLLETYLPRA